MSYQALARKYRPSSFSEIVGQQHVLNSLVHALETQKVHHAYLFTGTRGVGKTTLGRLLAKCLNCKTKVTAQPCEQCESCIAVNNNNFVDLIEIDAASRTGIDETKEILDNVQYMPSQGRYKVYLIDEIHMLSKQSFNALLKTLEEPPEYVKFILATTDYHKIPVTVLSRCIQLHLRHILQTDIKKQLKVVLCKENIRFDDQSLNYIAYHAKGSLRDALSLLDQAISFCGGQLKESEIKQMLGIIDSQEIHTIINTVINDTPSMVLPAVKNLNLSEDNAETVLDRIAEVWFGCCIYNLTQSIDATNHISIDLIKSILEKISVKQAHFLYQLTLAAKKEIYLAPNFETGLTMAILRLIAFKKKRLGDISDLEESQSSKNIKSEDQDVLETKKHSSQTTDLSESENIEILAGTDHSLDKQWSDLLDNLKLKGFTKVLAFNSQLTRCNHQTYEIILNEEAKKILEFVDPQSLVKLQTSISQYLDNTSVKIDVKNISNLPITKGNCPAKIKLKDTMQKIDNDKNIKLIKEKLQIGIKDENIFFSE